MFAKQRIEPRFAFVASAEVTDETSDVHLAARVSDLSLSGCYVDTMNPFPGGTPVQLKIFTQKSCFVAPALVVYSHEHLGMGLHFREMQPEFRGVLQDWLPSADTVV